MGKLVVLVVFLLLISPVLANDLARRDYLVVDTSIGADVDFTLDSSISKLSYLTINYSWIPYRDFRQDILSLSTSPDSVSGDNALVFTIKQPKDFRFSVDFSTRTSSDYLKIGKKVPFPIQNLPQEYSEFVEPTEIIDITPEIRSKAASLAGGQDDLYVVVFRVADWVNSNIEYNLSSFTAEASLPSSWVLQEKQGVCDELSNLFISMVRSLGIPARFVSGVAYTESELFPEKWGAHGWVEVYFPEYGWVPFDVTYNQLGFVDATHIKLWSGVDSNKYNVNYEWKGSGVDVDISKLSLKSEVKEEGPFKQPDVAIDVEFLYDEMGFGSYNVITANIQNLDDYYVSRVVSLSKTSGLEILGELKKDVLLKPGERIRVSWLVKVPDVLERQYIYTYPFSVYTQFGEDDNKSFKSAANFKYISRNVAESGMLNGNGGVVSAIDMFCGSIKDTVYVGDNVTIVCTFVSALPDGTMNVCIDDAGCKSVELKNGRADKYFVYNTKEPGFGTVLIETSYRRSKAFSFVSLDVIDEPQAIIRDIALDKTITFGQKVQLDFIVDKESFSNPMNVSIKVVHDLFKQEWRIDELYVPQKFSFVFDSRGLKLNDNELKIIVEYDDALGKHYRIEDVELLEFENLNFLDKVHLWFNSILMGRVDP